MSSIVVRWVLILLLVAVVGPVSALGQGAPPDRSELGAAVEAAMAAEFRSEADRARDRNRKPIETLEFFRLRSDMKVLELVPGGGWYTSILAPVLHEKGDLAVSMFPERALAALPQNAPYDRVREIAPGLDLAKLFAQPRVNRRLALPAFSFAEGNFDLVLTFRNLHNFSDEGRQHMNTAVFEALAPGGYYGVVDHSRRHMEADHGEVWRRMDPVEMIHEIEAAGFDFVDWSDLHYRPDDELRYEVGRKSVTGNTDRFTLLFQKPER